MAFRARKRYRIIAGLAVLGMAPAGTAVGLLKLGSAAVDFNGAVLIRS